MGNLQNKTTTYLGVHHRDFQSTASGVWRVPNFETSLTLMGDAWGVSSGFSNPWASGGLHRFFSIFLPSNSETSLLAMLSSLVCFTEMRLEIRRSGKKWKSYSPGMSWNQAYNIMPLLQCAWGSSITCSLIWMTALNRSIPHLFRCQKKTNCVGKDFSATSWTKHPNQSRWVGLKVHNLQCWALVVASKLQIARVIPRIYVVHVVFHL